MDKYTKLQDIIHTLGRVAVAYSGGVDSTLVLKVAYDCLGEDAIGLIAVSPSLPPYELAEAEEIARSIGVRVQRIATREAEDPRYLTNAGNRCYFCKTNVYGELAAYARAEGYAALLDGTNADDTGDHRPGRLAAREQGVRSPLQEAGLTKDEVRALARKLGLPNWDKPAAACLASRIPYGTTITLQALDQVARAELALRNMGFRQLRVRHHGAVARLEVEPEAFPRVLAHREAILQAMQACGYTFAALDLAGFRSGSMNALLSD
ncbi:MAG: ATP-dependent sacrificial sulfur transferase LarE [Anaerolineae bacterium]|nr:MAG: ATP-dependent sacrificial sulfur transferase LarE [Anaerolineae bacterium]